MGPGWTEDGTAGPFHRTWQDHSNSWMYQHVAKYNQEDQRNCVCWYKVPSKFDSNLRRLNLCHKSIFYLDSGCWDYHWQKDSSGLTSFGDNDIQTNNVYGAMATCSDLGEDDCGGFFRRSNRMIALRRSTELTPLDPNREVTIHESRTVNGIWVRKPNHTSTSQYCNVDLLRTRFAHLISEVPS